MVNGMPQDAPANLRLLTTGCPCCTGRVALQVGLARALRDTRAVRALVEVTDPDHARRLEQALEQLPLSLSMQSAARIQLPGDAGKMIL